MSIKCRRLLRLAIYVLIIEYYKFVYSSDPESFNFSQITSELKNRLVNNLNDSNIKSKLGASLVLLSAEIETFVENDFLIKGQFSTTYKSDESKVIVKVTKKTEGGSVQVTQGEAKVEVTKVKKEGDSTDKADITIEVKLSESLGDQQKAQAIADKLAKAVNKAISQIDKLNKLKETDNFKSLVDSLKNDLAKTDKLKKALDKDANKTKIKELLKAEFEIEAKKLKIIVDKSQNQLLVTVTIDGNNLGDKGSSKVRVKNTEVLFEVKVKEDNNSKIAEILVAILNEALSSQSNSQESVTKPSSSGSSGLMRIFKRNKNK